MALAETLPSKRASVKNEPSRECQPFDIELLCAKLEVARLEQDVERSRRRYRHYIPSVGEEHPASDSRRLSMIAPRAEARYSDQRKEETTRPLSPILKNGMQAKQLFGALSGEKYQAGSTKDEAYSSMSKTNDQQVQLSRHNSRSDAGATRPKNQDTSKRRSITLTGHLELDESEEYGAEAPMSSPSNASKRWSRTFPLMPSKSTSKQRPKSAYGYCDTLKAKARRDDSPASPMGLVNEYTISYDLADMLGEDNERNSNRVNERRRDSIETGRSLNGLRSRSLLNLASFLKKDKTEVQTHEVDTTLADIPENPRPLSGANGHHVRQRSLPIHLHSDNLLRCKKNEREKKRRSFIGFFKIFQ